MVLYVPSRKAEKKEIEMDNILGRLGKVLYRDCHRGGFSQFFPLTEQRSNNTLSDRMGQTSHI